MPEFHPRRAEPGQEFEYTDPDGSARTLKADADGVIRPKTDSDVAILDGFSLPHAQPTAIARARAARRSTKTRKQAGKSTGKVLVEATGEVDTRGPGAPAVEPGVTDVKEG